MRRALLGLTTAAAMATFATPALAQKPADPPPESTDVAVQGTVQGDQMGEQREVTAEDVTRAANAEPGADQPNSLLPEAPLEAPPPPPRHKGLVLESSLGALAFFGKFGSEAPTAF